MEHYEAGSTTRTAAVLVGVSKTTAANYYHRLPEIIYQATEDETRLRGRLKSMRAILVAAGKVPVFRLLKCSQQALCEDHSDAQEMTLKAIMKDRFVPDSSVHSNTLSAYSVLDVLDFRHDRIDHSKLFADRRQPYQWH